MEDYKPNSRRFREGKTESSADERKRVEKVVRGKVKSRKRNEIRKFADVFIPEDMENVKSYILMDVVVPAIKKAISDTIDTFLYGESGSGKRHSSASKISYGKYYDKNDRPAHTPRTRGRYDYDDIILDNRGEAEEVLIRMDELIDTYGLASVADLYDLVGKTCEYTDNNYGWNDIRSAAVVRVRDGYLLKLPRALPLN